MSFAAAEAFTGVIGRWRDWQSQRSGSAELMHCGEAETARIASDLSLPVGDLRMLARHGVDAAALLYRRMADLGVGSADVDRTEPILMRDLQRACTLCESKKRCRRDFASSADLSAWSAYCPNDGTLQTLMSRPVGAANQSRSASQPAANGGTHRHMHAWSWALLVIGSLWLSLNTSFPPVKLHFNTASSPGVADTIPAAAVDCLDDSCLSAEQQMALRTLEGIRAQGWIRAGFGQLGALQHALPEARGVNLGEALSCNRAGGTTFYGFMFQGGCGRAGAEAAKHNGYNSCQPMVGGGACLFR